ncbi:hypothetical protein [Caulobacter hibisci]|uniref:Uncharacterized protein n=1 Tax=Caulobacter hibisci TaxID=2035993 RepID=A0ABS0T0I5_9CAUL|nr:hypothetical protein [Caulobacter hibisci]MBI1685036.1 hypothetical protein [Caulobacter hibisci]
MPDPRTAESPNTPLESRPSVAILSALQLGLVVLVWLLAIIPVGLAVAAVAVVRVSAMVWRAISSRAGR